MSVFNEDGERALQKAFERSDVQAAIRNMTETIIPYISVILSAALEEMKKEDNVKNDNFCGS